MPRFFTREIDESYAHITGQDATHISRALRMAVGDSIELCDEQGFDYDGILESIHDSEVVVRLTNKRPSSTEPTISVHLFQAMPKSDKMDWIIQKCVELGISEITPVMTTFCVSRPDEKSMRKKIERYQKIASSAAKQSGRGKIPVIHDLIPLSQAISEMSQSDLAVFFYEHSQTPLKTVVTHKEYNTVSILVGSEGGFSEQEARQILSAGISDASLGKRILRCETAPVAALSAIMYENDQF